jgi:hypothetical protein
MHTIALRTQSERIMTNEFIRGRIAENKFATDYLKDIVVASQDQDIHEHWDVQGILIDLSDQPLKFDVKALRRVNRNDESLSDEITWVEGTNVHGRAGWIKGRADYIVFERENAWTVIKREELYRWTVDKIRRKGNKKGKGLYELYQRPNRKDIITQIRFDDIDTIDVLNLPK